MNIRSIVLFLSVVFLLSACTPKQYVEQNSALIIFKTPLFKYADMGFLYKNKEEIKVEIYGSGQAVMSLEISKGKVCMSVLECMSQKSFNKKVLSSQYPDEILSDIFRGKQIFNGEGMQKTRNGFTQNIIKEDKYNIEYSVLNNEVIFRDTINAILIKIKKQQ